MKLSNGHYEVDTDRSKKLAESEWQKSGDNYSYETDKRFTAWKSKRGGMYFITMEYVEYIAMFFPRTFNRDRNVRGHTLVSVTKDLERFRDRMLYYEIPVPTSMVEQV